jgi:hypothetical protein
VRNIVRPALRQAAAGRRDTQRAGGRVARTRPSLEARHELLFLLSSSTRPTGISRPLLTLPTSIYCSSKVVSGKESGIRKGRKSVLPQGGGQKDGRKRPSKDKVSRRGKLRVGTRGHSEEMDHRAQPVPETGGSYLQSDSPAGVQYGPPSAPCQAERYRPSILG